MSKIFAHATTPTQPVAAPAAPAPDSASASTPTSAPTTDSSAPAPAASAAPASPAASVPASVDVTAILDGLAAKSSEHGLDWKKSIVDMLKLLDMDSSLGARKELAKDLSYSGDEDDSAAMNVWLHKEVIKKLAENGGKVPAELLH